MATEDNQHKSMSYISLDGSKEKARKVNKRGSAAQKKKPQRGMGVAQLERLRLQEMRWKKMTEMPSLDSPNLQPQFQYHHSQLPEPIPSVPVMHGAGHYGVPSVGGLVGGVDQQGLLYHRHGNGGGFGGSGHVLMDPHRVGGSSSLTRVVETSKELSSIPKLQQQWAVVPEHCDFCFKKKRFNEDAGFNGGKDYKYEEFSQVNNNVCDNINFNGGIKSFGARAARSAFYACHHMSLNEVVAVHRNGNSSMGRNNVVMEYEFFPSGKGGRSTCSKELGLPTEAEAEAEASVAVVGGEASYFTTSAYIDNNNAKAASNSVDLSLKL